VIDHRFDETLSIMYEEREAAINKIEPARVNAVRQSLRTRLLLSAGEYASVFERIQAPVQSTLSRVALSVQLLLYWICGRTKNNDLITRYKITTSWGANLSGRLLMERMNQGNVSRVYNILLSPFCVLSSCHYHCTVLITISPEHEPQRLF